MIILIFSVFEIITMEIHLAVLSILCIFALAGVLNFGLLMSQRRLSSIDKMATEHVEEPKSDDFPNRKMSMNEEPETPGMMTFHAI